MSSARWDWSNTMLDRVFRWVALDFDGHGWQAIAGWIVAAQVTLFLIGFAVDAIWFPTTSYGFFVAMLLFAGHVLLDATTAHVPRASLWAAVVTLFPPLGALLYGRKRVHDRRVPREAAELR
jgi:hypothetical protein